MERHRTVNRGPDGTVDAVVKQTFGAEVGVEIFGLEGQVVGQRVFETEASGPAGAIQRLRQVDQIVATVGRV